MMEQNSFHTSSRFAFSVLVIFFLCAIAGFGVLQYFAAREAAIKSQVQGVGINEILVQDNSYFAQAEQLPSTKKNAPQLVQLYTSALAQAKDPNEEGHIKYKIGMSHLLDGSYLEAIPVFKSVIANAAYGEFDRAYSAEALAGMYYSYADPKIPERTFADEPYKSMVVPGNMSLTYRHLFEYASSIYPLDVSEARIAFWYSKDLFGVASKSGTSSPEFISELDEVTVHVQNAKNDIARTQDFPARVDIPQAMLRLAIVDANLALLKVKSAKEAEASFRAAQDSATAILGAPDPFWYIQYALFLEKMYGPSSDTQIHNVLSNLENGQYPKDSMIMTSLSNQRQDAGSRRSVFIPLAKADPKFKELLISLGWQESDFK